jgi:hypothetical protein
MDSKCQFYALEVMSRERAAVARREMEYWLNEAEEWSQLRNASRQSLRGDDANLNKPADTTTSQTSAGNRGDFACGERALPLCDPP